MIPALVRDVPLHRQLLRSGLRESVGFRLDAALGLFEKLVRLLVLYHFFRAVLPAGQLDAVLRYLVVATVLEAAVAIDLIDEMAQKIATGEATYWLVRPRSHLPLLLSYGIGKSLVPLATWAVLLVAVAGAPAPIAALAVAAAYVLSFQLQYLISLIIFRTLNGWGVKMLYRALFYLLSGVAFPPALLPEPAAQTVRALPFQHVIATPARVVLGEASAGEIAGQLAWLLALGALVLFVETHQRHRLVEIGG